MAIDAAKLAVRISAEGVDQTSRQLRNLGLQIDNTGNQAKRSAAGHDAMARSTQNAGRQSQQATGAVAGLTRSISGINAGSVVAAAGIAGIGVAATGAAMHAARAGIQFEDAFAGVRKTVDATDAQLAMLESGIRDMATSMPMAATEIAGLAEAAGALGVKTSDIMEFTRVTALIGTTTDVASGQAATSLGQLSNVLNLTAEDYERFGSALVELGNNGASTESAILGITERAGASAQLIGFATEETLAWGSAVANLGIEVEAGGSSLQRFFIDAATMVSDAGTELEILAETAGMTGEAFQRAFNQDSSAALQTFITGLGQLDQAQQLATLSALGFSDVRITRTLLGLAANTDNLTNSLASAEKGWRENTAMAEEAEKRFETTASKLQILKNQATDAAIEGFEILGPAIGEAADMLGEFVVSIPPALEGMADFISTVQDMREADVSERTGLEGFLADIIELGSDANDVLNDLNAAINDLPTVVPLFDSKESNVSDVERNAEALLAAYEEVMGVSIVRTGDAVESLIAWEAHTGTSFATVDDIYRRYIGSTKEVYDANQEMLAGLSSGIDGSGQTGLDNLSTDLLALQSDWSDTARIIRDEQQAIGNGFQEFSTSAETGFTQSTLSYSRFITAFSGNTETALSSFDDLTQSIATGAIDFEQAASLYANIPRDQLVPAVTEAAAELRGKLADATLSEMDARAIEGQVNALKQIFPDLVAEIDGTVSAADRFANSLGTLGDVQDLFQVSINLAGEGVSEWQGHLSGAETALGFLQDKIDAGIPLTEKQAEQYDTLTRAQERYAGGIDDEAEALIDAEVAKFDFITAQDELNAAIERGEDNLKPYRDAVADAAGELDPAALASYGLAEAQGGVAEAIGIVIDRVENLLEELGLIPPKVTTEVELNTQNAINAYEGFRQYLRDNPGQSDMYVNVINQMGFTENNAQGGVMPQGGWSWVGEEGRELMYVPPGGQIFNHHTSNEMAQRLPGFAQGTGSKIDLTDGERQAIRILGEMDVVITPESMAQADAELAALLDARAMAVELGLGDAIIAQLDEDIAAKQGDLDLIGRIAGSAWGEGFLAELEAVDATEAMAGLLSDFSLDDIVSGKAGTDLGQQLVDLLQLEKIALEMGDLDLAAMYREQADAVNEELRRLGEVMGTEFVQGQIDGYNAEQVAAEWDARLADALAGPDFGQNIQASIDEMNEKIDLGILMGAPMDVIAGWQAERDQLVEEGATYWQDVVAAIAAGAFSPEEIQAFAEAGGDAFMDAMEETFSPEAIENIMAPVQVGLEGFGELLEQTPEMVGQFLDDILAGIEEGVYDTDEAFALLAGIPEEHMLPAIEALEKAWTVDLAEAMLAGNDEMAASILELLEMLGLLEDQIAATSDAADNFRDSATGIFYPSGPASGGGGGGSRGGGGSGGGLGGSRGSGGGIRGDSPSGLDSVDGISSFEDAIRIYEQTGDATLLGKYGFSALTRAMGDHGGNISGYMEQKAREMADPAHWAEAGNNLIRSVGELIKQYPDLWDDPVFWNNLIAEQMGVAGTPLSMFLDPDEVSMIRGALKSMVGAYITGRFYYDEKSGLMSPGHDPAGKSLRDRLTNPVYRSVEDMFAGITGGAPALGAGPRRTGPGGATGGFLGSSFRAFADGGVITSPLFGLVGEAGPEMVQPLKQGHPERERLIADIAEAVIQSTGSGATFVVDGKVFHETVGKRVMHSVNGRVR